MASVMYCQHIRAIHLAPQLPKLRKGKAVHAQAVGWPCGASGSDDPPAACHRPSTKAAVQPYGAKLIARIFIQHEEQWQGGLSSEATGFFKWTHRTLSSTAERLLVDFPPDRG